MYLDTKSKDECFGCEACVQICPKKAIQMELDEEGFRYPIIDDSKCINCGRCRSVCPKENIPLKDDGNKYVFGGYNSQKDIRFESTSGGAFSAIVEAYCVSNYVIFGAEAEGIKVFHSYIEDKANLSKFRKSKYSQSIIGKSFTDVRRFLKEGKKVLFSGTPCHIAALKNFLGKIDQRNLLTVEVVCEGVPSPLYINKLNNKLLSKYGCGIESIDYRYTGKSIFSNGKWDFEIMKIVLKNNVRDLQIDRWFNPFWSIWLGHLMTRPSCYQCPFATEKRISDITLGDLWGVHLYCPELYGNNGGASLVVANTEKGKQIVKLAEKFMVGHELRFEDALKYQSPMRKTIDENPNRAAFMKDLVSDLDYDQINKKWAKPISIKLLWNKYVWGNRQKMFFWNLTHAFRKKEF